MSLVIYDCCNQKTKNYIGVIGALSTALRNGKNIEPMVGFIENFNFSETSFNGSGIRSTDDLMNDGTPDGGSCAALLNVIVPQNS